MSDPSADNQEFTVYKTIQHLGYVYLLKIVSLKSWWNQLRRREYVRNMGLYTVTCTDIYAIYSIR